MRIWWVRPVRGCSSSQDKPPAWLGLDHSEARHRLPKATGKLGGALRGIAAQNPRDRRPSAHPTKDIQQRSPDLVGGSAGEDVTGVRVHRKDGTFVTATVDNGHWSAWWPSGESPEGDVRSEAGVFGDELEFMTTDGTTHVMTTW